MIQGARRQLPSWMVRSAAADQASISRIEGENNEKDSQELDINPCKPKKKVLRNQHDVEGPLLENKSHSFKKREANSKISDRIGTSKRKSIKQDEEVQCDDKEKSDSAREVNVKAGKRLQHGNEVHLLKKCRVSRRKRISNKQCEHADESDMENKDNVVVRKRNQGNAPRRQKQKAEDIMDGSHDIKAGSISCYDEFTVDDLVSIAQEYVNAGKDKELQNTHNMGYDSETQPLLTTISKTGSDKGLTANQESSISVTDNQSYSTCLLVEPSLGGSIINPSNSGDPARDMLDVFLGPLLRTTEEVERKTGVVSEKTLLDHEFSERNLNGSTVEMNPVTKKKGGLKDKISMLLD